jgi:GAF domain-containing protein
MVALLMTELPVCADIKSAAECLLRAAVKRMQAPLGNVQIIDWNNGYLEIIAQTGFQEEFLSRFKRVTILDPSACGRVLLQRAQVLIEDVMADSEYAPFRDVAARAGYRSVQSTPIQSSSGAVVGVVSTHWRIPWRPSDEQLNALGMMAELTANTIIRLRVRSRLTHPV